MDKQYIGKLEIERSEKLKFEKEYEILKEEMAKQTHSQKKIEIECNTIKQSYTQMSQSLEQIKSSKSIAMI